MCYCRIIIVWVSEKDITVVCGDRTPCSTEEKYCMHSCQNSSFSFTSGIDETFTLDIYFFLLRAFDANRLIADEITVMQQ